MCVCVCVCEREREREREKERRATGKTGREIGVDKSHSILLDLKS